MDWDSASCHGGRADRRVRVNSTTRPDLAGSNPAQAVGCTARKARGFSICPVWVMTDQESRRQVGSLHRSPQGVIV